MATAQQLLDLKYNRQLLDNNNLYLEMYSPELLNYATGGTTLQNVVVKFGRSNILKGLDKIPNVGSVSIYGQSPTTSIENFEGVMQNLKGSNRFVMIMAMKNLGNFYSPFFGNAVSVIINGCGLTGFSYPSTSADIESYYDSTYSEKYYGTIISTSLLELDLSNNDLTQASVDFLIQMLSNNISSGWSIPIIIRINGGTNAIPTTNAYLTSVQDYLSNLTPTSGILQTNI